MEIKRGSRRTHPVENSRWKRLWTCRKKDYVMVRGHVVTLWIALRVLKELERCCQHWHYRKWLVISALELAKSTGSRRARDRISQGLRLRLERQSLCYFFFYGEQTGFSIVTLIACVSGGAIQTGTTAVFAVLARRWGLLLPAHCFWVANVFLP